MYFMHRRSAASGSITVVRPGGEFVSSKSGLELVLHATGGSGDRVVDALLRAGDVCAAVALSVFRSGVRCTDEASASPPLSDLAHNFRRRGSLAYITKKKKKKRRLSVTVSVLLRTVTIAKEVVEKETKRTRKT